MWRAVWKTHGTVFIWVGVLKVFHDLVMFLPSYILERLLHHLGEGGDRCECNTQGVQKGLAGRLLHAWLCGTWVSCGKSLSDTMADCLSEAKCCAYFVSCLADPA